ncbi:hypothetical protein TWF970_004412 [Orbilia oligospora]|uniref:Transmembrane protein n=1 Tax=Orbilia oligospora TaxID=2813651 RepID=A0A7C8RDP1_ORBOL|nr:hypothetical protein TWF970_004412 [Orbilia oligospora]
MELYYTRKYHEPRRVFADYNLRLDSRQDSKPSLIDDIKILLEDTLRQPISFWPLRQPRTTKLHPKFFRRMFWDCDCGMEMHADIPLDRSDYMDFQFIETSKPRVDTVSNQELPVKFQIYFCAEGDCGRDVMTTIKSDNLTTDQALFQQLRINYAEIRGWRLLFSLTHVHDIRSVRFWRGYYARRRQERNSFWNLFRNIEPFTSYAADLCDIKEENVPPIDDDEYLIPHRQPPSWLIRPIGRRAIMDHFSNPTGGRTDASDCLRYAMPKKLTPSTRSGFSELYGLHAEEAICPTKILIWGVVVHFLCFCIGGYLPWWIVSVAYFGLVFGNIGSRVRKNRKYGDRYELVYLYN